MSFGEFFLQSNNGNKVNLNFKGKLKRGDFSGNEKLLKIFDYFDTDKSGVIENLTKDGKNEIANIFAHIKQASELREGEGNTVLDSREAISLTSFIKDLNGVTASELFEFFNTLEEKKNVVKSEKIDISADGTKTIISTFKDGSVETDVFYPNGELKLRVTETPISEDFTNGKKNIDLDTEVLEKDGSDGKKEMLSLAKGAKEGTIVLEGDSAKYLSEKYNKEVVSAYYKNGVMELRDKNNKPVMRVAVDISQKVEQELREFVGKHLKESSENILKLAKTVGWIDKLGIDLQDISINKTNLALSILNPALLLTALEANGKEKLEEYLNQLRENVKNGELLEIGATTQGAFDSRFERITGHSEVNFLQIERLRQTADKYNNVQGLNQRIVLLNQGIKEVKQLYQNYRAQKQGVPNSGKLNSNFDGKILEILTQFFNGDENVAKALIQTISKGITSKDDLYKKFNAVLTTIKQKASETKADLLKGESEEELKTRYENEYRAIYGQDAVFKAEELITNGKETGGMIQIGMMTAAQMLLAAATMGTGNAALMALQSNALIGFLSTVGTDYALSLSNILSSERGFTAEAQEELHQRTLGTAEFIGFGMVAANPLSRAVGKYAFKLFASDAEKVLEGAFAQEVKAGTNAVTRTTAGALTKTTLSLESALEWVVVKGAEFGTEILSFSGLELLQEDEEFKKVLGGQASTLTKLKVMNSALQVMLGSFVRNQALRGQSKLVVKECNKMLKDMGIEGGKLTENKRPGGSNYTLEINGETMTFKDIKELQANFMAVLAENYIKARQIPEEIKNLDNDALVSEFTKLIQKQDALSESENARLVDLYQELQNRELDVNEVVNADASRQAGQDRVRERVQPADETTLTPDLTTIKGEGKRPEPSPLTPPPREGNRPTLASQDKDSPLTRTSREGNRPTSASQDKDSPLTPTPREGNSLISDPRYTKPLTPYTEAGNKIHELKSFKSEENPQLIAEIKADIEALRKTDPQKAQELQIVLEMFTNPTVVSEVTDAQIDAVVNYLNDHYDHLEGYLTEQVGAIGISDPKIGRFGHRIKGEWSTRDKVANFIKDAIKEEQKAKENGEEYTPKTLLSAFKDVRDKYACRTVFELGDFTKHPEVKVLIAQAKTLANEGKPELAAVKMHEAELKAAKLQSEPVRLQLLEAMRRAKEEGKDLKAVRISNYASENGIPIFTSEQMESLKLDAAQMGIDVEFIRLAKEIDPKAETEFVDGASTKKQPSGYTALQINFETKTGEVIEWQYRGELVNEFAEAEHLPYDLRTGKHPWNQIPELKTLYEPVAGLLQEKVMPKPVYKQLNRYFTDYYTHLRRLELGFESEEPKLSDYENWTAKDENGVEQRYTYKFDSRLEAKNLMELHHFAEGIKDGLITPERALEEFNMFVEKQAKAPAKTVTMDVKSNTKNEQIAEVLNIFNSKDGLKNIQENVKAELSRFIGNSKAEYRDEMVKLIDRLKNAKQRYGKNTPEYTDEQLLEIIKVASNPDGTLNFTVLQRICKRMDGGPRDDNSKMTRILPMDTKEHNLARRSDGFYDEDLVEIGKKLMYAHETREEIFKLIKDENGNPVKELIELIKNDKNEDFDDGEMLLNALRSLYTDGRLDFNKVNQLKELVNGGLTIYSAAGAMQSGMPADIVKNMPLFAQKGLSRSEVNSVVEYLKNKNIEPTFEAVKNTVENCGDIPELRKIHIKHLLSLRGETMAQSIYNNVMYSSERINEYYKRHPELAKNKPDLEAQFIKLLYIEGRTTQFTPSEILDLLSCDSQGRPIYDIDKLVDCGVLRDISGRRKPLSKSDLLMLQKEDIDVLKKAVEKGLLGDEYMGLCNLSWQKHVIISSSKTKLAKLTELSDTELKNLMYMDWSDLDFDTAISLAKCDPKKVDFVLDAMNIYTVPDYQKILLRDFNVDLAYKLFKEIDPHTTFPDSSVSDKVNDIIGILFVAKPHNIDEINYMYDNRAELGITTSQIKELVSNEIKARDIRRLAKKIGKENISKIDERALPVAIKFADFYKVNDINELSAMQKRKLRTSLTDFNANLFDPTVQQLHRLFPLLPKDQTEYCSTMRDIVNSLGIETKPLTETQIRNFNESSLELGQALGRMSDNDFYNLRITQEYSREDFIKTVQEKTKNLPKREKLKVYDYFGFELHSNETNPTGYTLTGYPANINNGVKLAKIKSEETRRVVENLRGDVIRFSENNKIKCNDPQVEKLLNQVMETLPELRTMIGRTQHGTHDFDVMQHTLKVLQKITQDPYFEKLNESDKKVVTLATLMHDMTKTEGKTDATHAIQGSFDGFFISKKFNLTREEGIKMYTLMNMHEWLSFVNKPITDYELNNYIKEYNKNHSKSEQITQVTPDLRERLSQEILTKRLQSVAFDLQQDNLFELSLMFTHADLKAVKKDDYFHDTSTMSSCATFDGKKRVFEVGNGQKVSHGQAADIYAERIRGYVDELKKTRPITPVTKVPDSETIRSRITQINPDGSTNFKGVFVDKDGLIVIKFNDVEDWEALGFPKGTTTKGIKGTGKVRKESGYIEESEFETGNFKFFAHALNYANQLSKFDSFALPDSDVLLSVTYMERPESKYRNFNTQGIGLYVQSKYVHGGGNTDAGSGTGKSISEFKKNYIFGGKREKDRTFTADIVKRATGMSDEQYVQFYEKNKNKTWEEVEPIDGSDPIEFRNKLIKAYAENIVSNERGDRAYDEYYVTNPEEPMFAWVYASDKKEKIGPNPLEFLHRNNKTDKENKIGRIGHTAIRPVEERTQFLREYCLNRNKVMFVFGD